MTEAKGTAAHQVLNAPLKRATRTMIPNADGSGSAPPLRPHPSPSPVRLIRCDNKITKSGFGDFANSAFPVNAGLESKSVSNHRFLDGASLWDVTSWILRTGRAFVTNNRPGDFVSISQYISATKSPCYRRWQGRPTMHTCHPRSGLGPQQFLVCVELIFDRGDHSKFCRFLMILA